MKSTHRQAHIRAPKASACPLCQPQKRGSLDKNTLRHVRLAVRDEPQLREL